MNNLRTAYSDHTFLRALASQDNLNKKKSIAMLVGFRTNRFFFQMVYNTPMYYYFGKWFFYGVTFTTVASTIALFSGNSNSSTILSACRRVMGLTALDLQQLLKWNIQCSEIFSTQYIFHNHIFKSFPSNKDWNWKKTMNVVRCICFKISAQNSIQIKRHKQMTSWRSVHISWKVTYRA